MAVSKAQQKATAKYESKVYDKTLIRLPKGKLDIIKAHAESRSESVNGFINRAIDNQMQQDKEKAGESHPRFSYIWKKIYPNFYPLQLL